MAITDEVPSRGEIEMANLTDDVHSSFGGSGREEAAATTF